MRSLLLLGCMILLASWKPDHQFYISHIQLEYDQKEKSLQVTAKIFTDDLQLAMENAGQKGIKLNSGKQTDKEGPAIQAYLESRLKISTDGKIKGLKWVGHEHEADVTWIYLEIPAVNTMPGSLAAECTVLTELHENQINIFDVRCGTFHETKTLNKRETSFIVNLK